jgi:hypothetical protein
MPKVRSVSNWRDADERFNADFVRARETGHDAIAARIRHTARGVGESTGDVTRDRLIIETDLKLLAKWDKRYSDKLVVDSKQEVLHRYDLDRLPDERLDELERILADAARGEGGEVPAQASSVH